MNEVQLFTFNESVVRTIETNEGIWFVGKDVADILGYARPNDAITTHCKGALKHRIGVQTGKKADGSDAIQQLEVLIIPERDVYRLIMRSRLPEAEKFEEWVVGEVLPSIRKNGGYLAPTVDFSNPETMMKLLSNWAEDRKKLEQAQLELVESAPKVDFYNAVTDSKDTIDMAQVAKVLNMKIGRNKLFALLREQGVLMDNNEPMQSYVDRGWFRQIECKYVKDGDVRIYIKTVVFQKGVDGIRKILMQVRGDA